MNRVITAKADADTVRAFWTTSRADTARAFRSARRHSRMVRILRIAVPVVVLASLVALTLSTYLNPLRMLKRLPVDIGDLVVSGTKITMEQPRLSGFTRDARAYQLSADAAAQDLHKPDIVELRNIHAKVGMQDQSTMEMSAIIGVYDTKAEILKLQRNIRLSSSTGYHGLLSEAVIDIRNGHVTSDQPVEVTMLQGTLNANKLEIQDSGEVVRFFGGVTMDLMMNGAPLPAGLSSPANAPSPANASVPAKKAAGQ